QTIDLIRSHIAARLDGGPNRKAEDIKLGQRAGLKVEMISALWDDALKVDLQPLEVVVLPPEVEDKKIWDAVQPKRAEPPKHTEPESAWGRGKRRRWGEETASKVEGEVKPPLGEPKIKPTISFHDSDKADAETPKPLTIEEKQR